MYNWQIILILIGAVVFYSYLFFRRQTKNFFMNLFGRWKKRYVVVHLKYSSGTIQEHNIVAEQSGLTKVENYSYELKPQFSILTYKGRLHYLVNENDSQPVCVTEHKLIFVASEIQTSFNNKVMEYLFSQNKNILIYGLFILGIIAVISIIYNIYSIQQYTEMLKSISRIEVGQP